MPSANADLPMLGRPATMIEVAGLEARRHLVDVAEAGGRAGHLAARLVHLRDLLEALADEHLDVLEAAADPVLGEVEHHLLGPVDELRRLARAGPSRAAGSARRRP